jgi:PAS domain S-box-containing protein
MSTSDDATASLRDKQAARRQAQLTLVESQETLKLFINSVTDYALFLLDPQGYVLSWNRGAQRIKGYQPGEILGRHFSLFYPPEEQAQGRPEHNLLNAQTEGRFEDEGWRVRKDGTRFWANVIITALRDEKGILRGFGKVTRDLTERKRAEEALRQANVTLEQRVATRTAELQRSLEDLQQFAHIVAHDLQEPLRMVTSFVQLLAQRYQGRLDTDAGEYIGYAVEGTQRMYQLLQDLLAYARLEAGEHPRAPTDLEQVVADTLKILQPALTESGATVTHGPLPTVVAESRQIGQVVQNLLSNALKFRGPEAPRIHLWAQQQGGEWVIAVQDNGIGIEPQHVERIFGMFQRLHSREAYPGTGMGLAICKKIVERHGGRIWVESTPGQGATFFFTLPMLCGKSGVG